jgi:hypothetical protein
VFKGNLNATKSPAILTDENNNLIDQNNNSIFVNNNNQTIDHNRVAGNYDVPDPVNIANDHILSQRIVNLTIQEGIYLLKSYFLLSLFEIYILYNYFYRKCFSWNGK